MAFDEELALRVRGLLDTRADVDERKMFGGIGFLIAGSMCCGVHGDDLIARSTQTRPASWSPPSRERGRST